MAKRTKATNWYPIVPEDTTGNLFCVDFTCPYCGFDNTAQFFTRLTGLSSFETDQKCDMCDKDVIVECY